MFISVVASLVALHQNQALLGKSGLLPADKYLNDVKHHVKTPLDRLQHVPTVLWFVDYKKNIDVMLDYIAYAGLALSGFITLFGSANMVLMIVIWFLYHSIVNVGQRW